MAVEHKLLIICSEVAAGTTDAETYTPSSSVTSLEITSFVGEAAFSPNSVVKLVWKWDHATETEVLIWSTKGSSQKDLSYEITDCDGVRKLAVVLENGEDGSIVMSGECEFREHT